jgi:glycosyltransferase involved in cell wall biosynthesis
VVLGFVGRLNEVKGLKYLLRSLQQVVQTRPAVLAVLVGDGPEADRLKALARQLGIEKHVRFAGIQSPVAPWFEIFDVAVFPSLSEGLPLAVLEAMSSNTPVIASQVGGIPEVICDGVTGQLIPPRDEEALRHAIISLIDSSEDRRRLASAARKVVSERLDAARASQQLRTLYQCHTRSVPVVTCGAESV